MKNLLTFLLWILNLYMFIHLGLKGRRKKKEREHNADAKELLGPYEGAVQDYWLGFIIIACVIFIVGISQFLKYLVPLVNRYVL